MDKMESISNIDILFENNPVPMAISYMEQIIEVNAALLTAAGFSREDLIGKTRLESGLWDDAAGYKKMLESIEAYGQLSEMEIVLRQKDGKPLHVLFSAKMIQYDGRSCMLSAMMNITDFVAEREKRAELERFFAVNPELMAVLDRDANLIKLNGAWETVLGYSSEDLKHHGYLEFVHPDDKKQTLAAIASLSGPTHQVTTVNRFRTHDGSYRYLEWHAHTYEHLVYVTARDITELTMDKNSLKANLDMKEKHLELMNLEGIKVGEFLDHTLEQIIAFTKSKLGYIFLYNSDSQEFSLHSWSRMVMDECKVEDQTRLYHLTSVGLWGEVVRQKKPIIVNDYQAPSVMKKGYPEGHVAIRNFVSIPVFKNGDIVAVVAASNKSSDYTDEDVLNLELLMNTVWPVVERMKTEELLRKEKELLSTTLLTVGVGIVVTDREGKILLSNPMAELFSGFSKGEIAGRNFNEVFHMINLVTREDAPNPVFGSMETISSRSAPKDLGIISKDGSEIRLDGNTNIIRSESGEITGFVISLKDISREYEQEKEIEGFLNVNLDMLCVWDLDGKFHKVNKKFTEVTGYTMEEIEGKSFVDFVHEEDHEDTVEVLRKLANMEIPSAFTNRIDCKDGSYKYIEWHTQPGIGKFLYSSARDVTKIRMQTEQLREIAVRDELTGLYNRHYFEEIIEEEMEQSDRYGTPLSLMMLDLDHFKLVNDTWGHPIGDEQLKLTARTMENVKRDSDILFRFGGEEFILLLRQTNKEGAVTTARKIRKGIADNCHPVTGRQTASIGVAERMRSESFRHWYRRVDEALYRAKERGRNRVILSDENDRLSAASVNIDWNIDWESGNYEIDEQHRKLVDIGSRLINMSYEDAGDQEIMCQLDRLLDHLLYHFKTEENILTQIGYPEHMLHAEIHEGLANRAIRLKADYQNGEIRPSAFFSFVLDDLIYGHMVNTDKKFFPYTRRVENRDIGRVQRHPDI